MTQANAAGADTPAQGKKLRWPQLALLAAAAFEFLTGLADLPILFGDISQVPGPGIGGAIIVAKIALMPIVALAALFFTVRGRMLYAILTMVAVMLLTWVSFLPSVAINGLEIEGVAGAVTIYEVFVVPLIALADHRARDARTAHASDLARRAADVRQRRGGDRLRDRHHDLRLLG